MSESARETEFKNFLTIAPKRKGRNPQQPARQAFDAQLGAGVPAATIIAAAQRWADRERDAGNIGTRFVPMLATWLGCEEWLDADNVVAFRPAHAPDDVWVEHNSARWDEISAECRRRGERMGFPMKRADGREGRWFAPSIAVGEDAA